MYANDATLSVSGTSIQEIQNKLNHTMCKLHEWTLMNKVILNTDKTKVMLVGSHQRISTYDVNGKRLECVSNYKCLGVTIDVNLTFSKHVENISLLIKQKLGIVRRLRESLTQYQLKQLYLGYVLPHALYCCTVWSSRFKYNVDMLNKLYKRAAYIISRQSWHIPLRQVLNGINWPTLNELFDKATCCLVFKCINNLAPPAMSDQFVLLDDVMQRTTRNSNKNQLKPFKYNTEFYSNTSVNYGVKVWNKLTVEARLCLTTNVFKRMISEK